MAINLEYIRGNVVANIQLGDLTGQVVLSTKGKKTASFKFESPTVDFDGRISSIEGELAGSFNINGDEYSLYTNNDTLFVDDAAGVDAGELRIVNAVLSGHLLGLTVNEAKMGDDTVFDVRGKDFALQGLIEPTRREINAAACTAEAVYEIHPQGDEHVVTRNGEEVFRMKTYDIWAIVRPPVPV